MTAVTDLPGRPTVGSESVRVVVVDGHAVWRAGVRATFARQADLLIVGESAVAAEALKMVMRVRPAVVLLDPTLRAAGRPAGVELCRALRSRCPDSRVLVIGPPGDDRCIAACIEAGATGYLGRDVDVDDLVTSVRAAAQGRRSVDRHRDARLREAEMAPAADALTGRQLEVLQLLARGMSNRDIAGALTVAEGTVKFHMAEIMRRLDVRGRAAAVYVASRLGLI